MKHERLMKAINYMAKCHEGQIRKTNGLPKSVHLFGVASILLKHNYDEDIVIAGLLHDVIEDTYHTIEEIETLFGTKVKEYVLLETEIDKKYSWKERKDAQIKSFMNASKESKAIAAADKIHNMLSLLEDYQTLNDSMFDSFNANKQDVLWYYQEITKAITNNVEGLIFDELKEIAKEVEKLND
ncbi:MAG: HD domain-containing protein [Bacilli bacterium]|nr:HD domain-containing protein [Bacilli bacterium]